VSTPQGRLSPVRAGLALVDAVPKLNTAAGVPLKVRVEIATGLMAVGEQRPPAFIVRIRPNF